MVTFKDIERIAEIKAKIVMLEREDKEKQAIINSGSYALHEGYKTNNMQQVDILENELDELRQKYKQ